MYFCYLLFNNYHFMKRFLTVFWVLAAVMSVYGRTITITVKDKTYQTITGFGAACCDGAMCPLGTDTNR